MFVSSPSKPVSADPGTPRRLGAATWLGCLLALTVVSLVVRWPGQASTAPDPAPPGIRPGEANRWRLIWHDEFDGASLDLTKWAPRGVGKRESAIVAPDAVSLDGHGILHLAVTEKDGVLQNAMIGTQRKFECRYGIFAARIRFPKPIGQHGSFWMQPASRESAESDPARTGAEIDVVEWFGTGRKDSGVASNVYWPGVGKNERRGEMHDLRGLRRNKAWDDDFHVYSVDWSEQGYVFRIDGAEVQRVQEGISRQPEYLILSLLTSDWETPWLDRHQLPNSMDVDWVRFWQKDSPVQ